jgi:hypothetical protein
VSANLVNHVQNPTWSEEEGVFGEDPILINLRRAVKKNLLLEL